MVICVCKAPPGSLLTLVFGVLNLIVAVVVDTFADARLSDVKNLAEAPRLDLVP